MQGILLCEIHFFSQFKDPNFKHFLGVHAQTTLNGLELRAELNLSLEKDRIPSFLHTGNLL